MGEIPVTVAGRIFAILRAFGPEERLGATDLARATGLPRSTVHRLATELVAERVLVRVGDKYRPGLGLFELGVLAQPSRLRDAVVPYLEDLQRVTGGDVQLAGRDGTDVVYLDHVPARRSTAVTIRLGARLPAHATAAGKVLLAHAPAKVIDGLGELRALTPSTITDRARLLDELGAVRADGYALDHEEAEQGRVGIAAPVANRHGRVLGALSVTAPSGAIDPASVVPSLQLLARTLTRVGQNVDIPYLGKLYPAPAEKPEGEVHQ